MSAAAIAENQKVIVDVEADAENILVNAVMNVDNHQDIANVVAVAVNTDASVIDIKNRNTINICSIN